MTGQWTLLGAPLDSSGEGLGEERAPRELRAAGLAERLGLRDAGDAVRPLRDPQRDARTGVIAAGQLAVASAALRDAVAHTLRLGERPFVLGGDCILLPGALAGARVAAGPLALWMVDGHPDALDGESSPTGEATDMDLAVVLGRGAPALTDLAGVVPIVESAHVALIGHRPASLGPDVAAELAQVPPAVRQTTALEVRARGAGHVAQSTLSADAGAPAWLHVDLDALDANQLPAVSYPQPDGLTWEELVELIGTLLAAPGLVGLSLTDFDADHDGTEEHARRIVDALGRAWPSGAPRTPLGASERGREAYPGNGCGGDRRRGPPRRARCP
jgi:arginase